MNRGPAIMAVTSQLPHILRLLDDDSPVVRQAVVRALASLGPGLAAEIKRMAVGLTPAEGQLLQDCLQVPRRRWLRQKWPSWFALGGEERKLEVALSLLADFQSTWDETDTLTSLLDRFAETCRAACPSPDAGTLARFIFETLGFTGAVQDYYQPHNSNLIHVIRYRKGIPISLCCLYILVGRRLGLVIRGCNLPRHFLAIASDGTRPFLVDCYHGGKTVGVEDIKTLSQETSMTLEEALRLETDAVGIMQRILGNLVWAYQQAHQLENSFLMIHLLRQLQHDRYMSRAESDTIRIAPDFPVPIFQPGQRVSHRREGYRAIIVDLDWYCMAGESWFQAQSSPAGRNQPWYHVLVHGSDQVRYVGQNDLTADASPEKISHPLLNQFFDGAEQGDYRRNNEPWLDI